MDLSIVIVSFNAKDYLRNCLDSIYENDPHIDFEVFVVDNASIDGSPDMVRKAYPKVIVIKNEKNLGFSRANNQAIKRASGRYVLLLNSDIELFAHTLERMVTFMDMHPEAGAIGARTWSDPQRTLQWCGHKHLTPLIVLLNSSFLGQLFPENRVFVDYWREIWRVINCGGFCEVDTVGGHCFMARRKAIDEVGLLDEKFFFFFEDADWSLRIKKDGWKLYHLADAELIHHLGKSTSDKEKQMRMFTTSMYYFMMKHYGVPMWIFLKLLLNSQKIVARISPFIKRIPKSMFRPPLSEHLSYTDILNNPILTWPKMRDDDDFYLFQISSSKTFIPCGSKKLRENFLKLPNHFFNEWPDGIYFWRVAPLVNNEPADFLYGAVAKTRNLSPKGPRAG